MKKIFRNLGILIFPFIIMITVNEIVRNNKTGKYSPFFLNGVNTTNSNKNLKDTCTWICYYQTTKVCKVHHVKYLNNYYAHLNELKASAFSYVDKNSIIGTVGSHTLNKRIMQGKIKSKWIETDNYKVYWFVTAEKSEFEIIPNNIPSVVECNLLKKIF